MIRFNLGAFFLLALAMLLVPSHDAHAAESYDNCVGFINSLPAVITTEGTWCMKQDLSTAITTGAAISISANNVTIDCNNFKLGGLAAGFATQAWGIYEGNRHAILLRHCNIRGFSIGAFLFGGSGHLVEDSRFDGNTGIGIDVEGDGSVVRRNRVNNTGKSTQGMDGHGISTVGSVDVLDNTVAGVTAQVGSNESAFGIRVSNNTDGTVSDNRIRGVMKDGLGQAIGIFNQNSNRLGVRRNDLGGDGGAGSVGIFCDASTGNARTMDNLISGFSTGIIACNNDSGNVITP